MLETTRERPKLETLASLLATVIARKIIVKNQTITKCQERCG